MLPVLTASELQFNGKVSGGDGDESMVHQEYLATECPVETLLENFRLMVLTQKLYFLQRMSHQE